MQVLFDNGVPRGVAAVLKEHTDVEIPFDPDLGDG
jgi:hypothetical protein